MIVRRARLSMSTLLILLAGGAGVAHAQQPKLEPLPPTNAPPLPPSGASTSPPPSTSPPASGAASAPAPGSPPAPEAPPASDFGAPPEGDPSVAPAPRAAPPALTGPRRPTGKDFRATFKGAAGYQYAQVNGIPVTGARLRLGAGAQSDTSAHYASLNILYGRTEAGLRTWDLRGAWNADLLRSGVFRLGVDVEMGYLVVRRATFDKALWALGVGAGVHASVDAYAFGPRDDHALYVEAKLDAHLHFGNAFMWGPSILAGIRY